MYVYTHISKYAHVGGRRGHVLRLLHHTLGGKNVQRRLGTVAHWLQAVRHHHSRRRADLPRCSPVCGFSSVHRVTSSSAPAIRIGSCTDAYTRIYMHIHVYIRICCIHAGARLRVSPRQRHRRRRHRRQPRRLRWQRRRRPCAAPSRSCSTFLEKPRWAGTMRPRNPPTHTNAYMHACTHTHTHARTHTRPHTHTHTHTHEGTMRGRNAR